MAAIKAGTRIINEPKLKVIHRGYPRTISEFIKREAWHGKGDAKSVAAVLNSRVALATMVFLSLHLLLLGTLIFSAATVLVSVASAILIPGFLLFCAKQKFSHSPPNTVLINAFIFYFYFLGRAISLKGLFSRKAPY